MASILEQISERGSIPWLYLSLDGRIGRQAYWFAGLILAAFSLIINLVFDRIVIGYVIDIALIYPSVCITGKRFHDRGKSAWWCLIGLVPLAGLIWVLIDAGILEGTHGANDYGLEPVRTSLG